MLKKSYIKILFILLILFCTSSVFASISEDAKKSIQEYAGYEELLKRGFKLNLLDSITTPEDLYKVLLPYMVVNGKPLDNTFSFNGYSFARHKTIHFEDIYGTKESLLKKGYKQEQLFTYPSKGLNIYRVGNFVLEPQKNVTASWESVSFYKRPFIGRKLIYFFPACYSKNHFEPYINEIKAKDYVVIDLRILNNGYGAQLYALGESLCKAG